MSNLNAKVIDKINKLLALGNNAAAAQNERETALRQAYSLLAKHNLEMNDLKAKDDRIQTAVLAKRHLWAIRLASSIAELFFCEYVTGKGNANYSYHIFVGREANTTVASSLFLYLSKSLLKEARYHVKKNNISYEPYKAEMDFLKGASMAIAINARTLREEKEKESMQESANSTGTSLVLASYYDQEREANAQWVSDNMQVKERSLKTDVELNANTLNGFQHGKKVNLTTGLTDQSMERAML